MALRKLPRWSMAAAAMTPFLFESAFKCLILPSESCMKRCSRSGMLQGQYNPLYRSGLLLRVWSAAPIGLRARYIFEDLQLQGSGVGELAFLAHEAVESHFDVSGRVAFKRAEEKRFDRQLVVAAESWPHAAVRDRLPAAAGGGLERLGDINAAWNELAC